MKKLLIIAGMALAMSANVTAQQGTPVAGGAGVAGAGAVTIASLTALGVSLAVAASIVSNSSGITLPPEQEFVLVCNAGDAAPVAGVCTSTTTGTATATASVSGTVTNTITVVPVTATYPAIVQPVN
jgi:hypothetical protein